MKTTVPATAETVKVFLFSEPTIRNRADAAFLRQDGEILRSETSLYNDPQQVRDYCAKAWLPNLPAKYEVVDYSTLSFEELKLNREFAKAWNAALSIELDELTAKVKATLARTEPLYLESTTRADYLDNLRRQIAKLDAAKRTIPAPESVTVMGEIVEAPVIKEAKIGNCEGRFVRIEHDREGNGLVAYFKNDTDPVPAYELVVENGTPVHCSCADHKYRNRTCKHMIELTETIADAKMIDSVKPRYISAGTGETIRMDEGISLIPSVEIDANEAAEIWDALYEHDMDAWAEERERSEYALAA